MAVDGVSLTVARVETDRFCVSVIPHPAAQTVLSSRRQGDAVNLEADLIGKYVEKLAAPAPAPPPSGITREFLTQNGF